MCFGGTWCRPLTQSLLQRRNFTLAFQAAESVGIKSTLVSPPPPIPSGLLSVRKRLLLVKGDACGRRVLGPW